MDRTVHFCLYVCLAATSLTSATIHEYAACVAYFGLAVWVLVEHWIAHRAKTDESGAESNEREGELAPKEEL